MSFEWPWLLLALGAVVPIAALLLRRPKGRWATGLFAAGLMLLVVATARPIATVSVPRVEGTLILAIDNSNSMLAADAEPTRIAAARDLAQRLVAAQPATVKVGVVSFSSGGVELERPTTRHERVQNTIDGLVPEGGTSLADGLFTSLGAVVGEPISITQQAADAGDITLLDIGSHEGAVIVVLSDGESRGGLPHGDVATLASNAGIRIFSIGLGEATGTILEVDGFTLATSLNEQPLAEVAEISGGTYFHASKGAVGIEAISDAVGLQLTFRGEESEITALVGAAGAALILLGAALSVLWFGRVL